VWWQYCKNSYLHNSAGTNPTHLHPSSSNLAWKSIPMGWWTEKQTSE